MAKNQGTDGSNEGANRDGRDSRKAQPASDLTAPVGHPTALSTNGKETTVTINSPVPFQGTDEERRANEATHRFMTYQYSEDDAETRCDGCDCRPSHITADYPCGTRVPREEIVYNEYGNYPQRQLTLI